MVVALVTVLSTSARAEERAYVANSGSDTVSVIDTATDLVIDTIAVGRIPNGIATTPNGVAVYVVNGGSPGAAGSVSMIDTTTNTVRATVPVGSNPYGVTVAPDGSLVYVANSNSGTLSVIETASNLVKTTIPVGRNPTAVAISPDGTVAYVADVDFPYVFVLSTETHLVVATVPAGRNPIDVAISPDGAFAYVATGRVGDTLSTGGVVVIDTATNIASTFISLPLNASPSGIAISADGSKAYVASIAGPNPLKPQVDALLVIDIANAVVEAIIMGVVFPDSIAINHDGTLVYVTNTDNDTVSVLDTRTNTIAATIPVGQRPAGIAITSLATPTPSPTATPTVVIRFATTRDSCSLLPPGAAHHDCTMLALPIALLALRRRLSESYVPLLPRPQLPVTVPARLCKPLGHLLRRAAP